jgi:hypothetical protein
LKVPHSQACFGDNRNYSVRRFFAPLNNDYRTPAEVAGVHAKGKDKWMTIIQNAQRKQTTNLPA